MAQRTLEAADTLWRARRWSCSAPASCSAYTCLDKLANYFHSQSNPEFQETLWKFCESQVPNRRVFVYWRVVEAVADLSVPVRRGHPKRESFVILAIVIVVCVISIRVTRVRIKRGRQALREELVGVHGCGGGQPARHNHLRLHLSSRHTSIFQEVGYYDTLRLTTLYKHTHTHEEGEKKRGRERLEIEEELRSRETGLVGD